MAEEEEGWTQRSRGQVGPCPKTQWAVHKDIERIAYYWAGLANIHPQPESAYLDYKTYKVKYFQAPSWMALDNEEHDAVHRCSVATLSGMAGANLRLYQNKGCYRQILVGEGLVVEGEALAEPAGLPAPPRCP